MVCLALPLTAHAQQWHVTTTPTVVIGDGAIAQEQFERIDDVAVLSDGRIVVLDGQAPAVRLYTAAGRWIRDIGRTGEGPGEYQDPIAIAAVPDGIAILDRSGRLEVVSLEGRAVRSDRVPLAELRGERFTLLPVRPLADGTVLMRAQERVFGRVSGEYRQQGGLFRARDNRVTDSIGWFVDDSGRTDRTGVPVPRPYLPTTGMLVATGGNRIVVMTADQPTVAVLDLRGRRVAQWRVPGGPGSVDEADINRVRNSLIRGFAGNDLRVVREWHMGRPVMRRAPYAASILISAARPGEVWLERWGRVQNRAMWLVVHESGSRLGEVELPPGVELIGLGQDFLMGLVRDEDDVESVVRLALRAP
jgi:hypothetical protein